MDKVKKTREIFTAKRVAMLSLLTAMGLVMFMVESLFPPLFLPGAKMGLSNIFSLLTLYALGPVDALILVVIRTTLGSMFTGNMSTLMYSLSAGLVSVLVSAALTEFVYPRISVIAVSVVSAVMHNLTQNVVFCLVSDTPQMFSYMPWLALLGVVAGLIVGFAVFFIIKGVPLRTFASAFNGLSVRESAESITAETPSGSENSDNGEIEISNRFDGDGETAVDNLTADIAENADGEMAESCGATLETADDGCGKNVSGGIAVDTSENAGGVAERSGKNKTKRKK